MLCKASNEMCVYCFFYLLFHFFLFFLLLYCCTPRIDCVWGEWNRDVIVDLIREKKWSKEICLVHIAEADASTEAPSTSIGRAAE